MKNETNENKYWMKRRRYGWGWTPTSWQGWLLLLLQGVVVIAAATQLPPKPAEPSLGQLVKFFVILISAVATLVLVSSRTAPAPHWRWGKKSTDKPGEDL